jgi:glycosyltransferase involved in cell wall biosynthesis
MSSVPVLPDLNLPPVSIVTPSYNMAEYLRDSIESVLTQDYPRLEYLIIDGGSTDGTLAILESYGSRLRHLSGPDRGAADAINRGFELSSGDIFAWLNADDTYLPGAVRIATAHLSQNHDAAAVYGEGQWVDARGRFVGRYPTQEFDMNQLARECYICQPACFMRRTAFAGVNRLDESLHFAFDYDLWIKLARRAPLVHIPETLATSRMHAANKTLSNRKKVFQEGFHVLQRHFGYVPFSWIHSYVTYLMDGRDQFYEPLEPSIAKFLLSLPMGICQNRHQPKRYFDEWRSVINLSALKRRL